MSRTSFRVNPHSMVCLNIKELARSRRHIWSLSDSDEIRTHNHLVRKWTYKLLSVRLRTKWLWVRISLLSRKFQIWHLVRARNSLTFRQTIEPGFTLKLVRNMIITCSQITFTANLDRARNTTTFFISKEAKKLFWTFHKEL